MLALLACVVAPSALAQTAGRVVLAVGDVAAVRGADRVRLAAGANVVVGDTIVTGAQSHAQIRFSDEALVALKPDSEFRIEQFTTTGGGAASDRAVFRLIRGGFRTITGSIGRLNADAYQVQTTQATIGIRGTHYALQICAVNQCRNAPDEPPASSGLYGGVFEGRVAVANALGNGEYGAREFFFVPDGEPPQRWLVPPLFLADEVPAPAQREVKVAEVNLPKLPQTPVDFVLPVPPFVYVAGEDLRNPLPERLTGTPEPPPVEPPPTPSERVIAIGSDRAIIALGRTPSATVSTDAAGALSAYADGSLTASRGTAQPVDVGSDAANGAQVNWGRWAGAGSSIVQVNADGSQTRNDGGNLHYVYGNVATDLPSSGVVFYTPSGGTRPTDSTSGVAGSLVSGGSVSVDFTAARVALSGLTVGFSNANYTLSGNANLVGSLFSTSPVGATVGCTGSACKPLVAGNFAGFLAGPGGSGLGLDYFFNIPGGVIEGVAGYHKCPGPTRC